MKDEAGLPREMQSDIDLSNMSRAEYVYYSLRYRIRNGELRPGDRLREVDLAKQLNVSRTPIREAIHRMESEGLVEIAPSRGVMLTQLDQQQVRELYALRASLEGTAARFAAQHATAGEFALMRELLNSSPEDDNSIVAARSNQLFHQSIYDAAHNRYLMRALHQLGDSLALLPGTTFQTPGRAAAARREHTAVLDAMEKRDVDKAEQLMRSHIELAGQVRIRQMFDASQGASSMKAW